ncbi:MAG: DNA-formamidopyrimidine glycosylase [Firmicutes bacterium]|nr:DNA-formamidopyrimidine glycosylase [Bacillota bacterium]
MPELPEVETVRRTLEHKILGHKIQKTNVLYPRLLQNVDETELADALKGRYFTKLARKGKYLITHLDSDAKLVIHLRMTGQLTATQGLETPLEKHTSLQIHFEDELELRLVDQRKFATLHLVYNSEFVGIKGLAQMGVEPLDESFTPQYLKEQLEGRRAAVKSVLLDQRRIGGLGNIYADESLFRSGIFPGKPAGSLTINEIQKLHTAIENVISEAIRHRGTSFRDYVDGDGQQGSFQARLQVYGKEGDVCQVCGQIIARMKIAGRSSYYCADCQG